jgi:hypothetical protein
MECARVWAIPWHSVRFVRELETHVMIAQRLGFVSGASTAPVLRATDEPAKMMFRMRERVMKNLDGSEPGQRALRSNERR